MPSSTRSDLRTAIAAATAVLLAACSSTTSTHPDGTFTGDPVGFAGGTVRTYLVARDGVPDELGVAIDSAAMAGLPDTGPGMGGSTALIVPLPAQAAAATPYRLVELDWNPHGHDPAGVYDKPHFDVHFYEVTQQERDAIDPSDPQFDAKAANHPPADQLPASYVPIPGAVPQMGVHWVDPASPELHGTPFTQTFLYGSWNGATTFVEPMITRAFLESTPRFVAPIPQPAAFPHAGEYPASYVIYHDAPTHAYRVALTGFTAR